MAKILYIGSFQYLWNEESIARGLEKLGYEVIRVEEEGFELDKTIGLLDQADILLMAKLKIGLENDKNKLIGEAKKKRVKVVSWVWDLYWGLDRELLLSWGAIFKADLFLSPDGGNQERFKELGINHKLLRQAIPEEYCYLGTPSKEFEYDVIFVGSRNGDWPYRDKLCQFLGKNYNFRWIGTNNPLEIRGHKLNELYASAKIIMGDSVYAPYYWSNRIYDTIGRGGFFIHPLVKGIIKDYSPSVHFVPYNYGDFVGLKQKIDYYLVHEDERREIAIAGMEHTKQNHTVLHRCKKLMEYVENL